MFCIDFIYFSTEGTENQLIKMINHLDHDRFDVYLLCLKNTSWLDANKGQLKCSVTAFKYNEFKHPDPRNAAAFVKIVRHIKDVAPDIVITFFKISYILGVLAARLAGVKTILATRRDYGIWLDPKGIHLLRFANRFVHGIITNSEKVKELTARVERYDRSKIQVIYNGIDIRSFNQPRDSTLALKASMGIPSGNKVVGIVAGLREMKRHAVFLDAAKKILEARPDVSFLVVGDGPLRSTLERQVDELGIWDSVFFLGWQTDIPRYVALFDIGVNCSSMEGLSNAIMEYMATGIPCVVSDAGGNPELIRDGENGYTFKLDDAAALASRVLTLLNDPNKQREFAARSVSFISTRMTMKTMIGSYERYFEQILEHSRRTGIA